MRRQYDDFTQMKIKDMSKAMSDMTYKFVNPETNQPTVVPPAHYEKILDRVQEQYMSEITQRQFLTIMYNQLTALKKEDERYFNQALLCIDMGLNPKDLRIGDQIAVAYTSEFIEDMKNDEKKKFHLLRDDISKRFNDAKNDLQFQAMVINASNEFEFDEENKKGITRDR